MNSVMNSLRVVLLVCAIVLGSHPLLAEDKMVDYQSKFGFDETVSRIKSVIADKGLRVIAEIDHAKGAAGVDLELRPTLLIMFGHPKAGTPIMQQDQRAGVDLPLRLLVWEGEDGKVIMTYHDPRMVAEAWPIDPIPPQVMKMAGAIASVAKEAGGE